LGLGVGEEKGEEGELVGENVVEEIFMIGEDGKKRGLGKAKRRGLVLGRRFGKSSGGLGGIGGEGMRHGIGWRLIELGEKDLY